jgi:hypothetical protein
MESITRPETKRDRQIEKRIRKQNQRRGKIFVFS